MVRRILLSLCIAACVGTPLSAGKVELAGLEQPVEILRDRWGVPHIYAETVNDLFFAQGYITARDRLWQLDLWRRIGTGKLAEVLGPEALERDRLARAVRFRGDWDAEWQSYHPETKRIATAFTNGINAYIRALSGKRPQEFQIAGYDPGLWEPEDCVARVAGLQMSRNVLNEVRRVLDVRSFGLENVERLLRPDPFVQLEIPNELDLNDITDDILGVYRQTVGTVQFPAPRGSNNWVLSGALTASGRPMLANDPHRAIQVPSLRKTVHLVGPGWNVIGAGEPALPGVALGHNERIAWGFTIVGIDQQDLYVERLNPKNPNQYLYRGEWRDMEIERPQVRVRGRSKPAVVELRYTLHGPVIHMDRKRQRAYALRWVGTEPGTAGYLAALRVSQARNWSEFLEAMGHWLTPSQNMVYADVEGNIGWQASGLAPIRPNWSGLFPVPGHTGEYEWEGFRGLDELPRRFNPAEGFIATANHNILPPDYAIPFGYEWAMPFRFLRIHEVLSRGGKFTVSDMERLQLDVVSHPARRFQTIVRKWVPPVWAREAVDELTRWNASVDLNSRPALLYEVWISKLPAEVFGPELGARVNLETTLKTLEGEHRPEELEASLKAALEEIEKRLGANRAEWRWGRLHQVRFRHALDVAAFHRGPFERPGDGNTVNNTSGPDFRQGHGASYRQIFDLADWDRGVITNAPGESGNPDSPHYDGLIPGWREGKFHPLPFSRKAVEAAASERILLVPAS